MTYLLGIDAGWLGPGTRSGCRRTSQEGPWLHTAQKSNASQQEVRAELTEDTERVQMQTEHLGDSQKKRRESCLCLGTGVFSEEYDLVHVSSQASRNPLEGG